MTTAPPEHQVALLAALAQATRLRIVAVVAEAGEPGLAAGGIARTIRCPASTLSFHLKELAQAGVLEARQSGRFVIYRLRRESLAGLATFLAALGGVGPPSRVEPPEGARRRGATSRRSADADQLSMFAE